MTLDVFLSIPVWVFYTLSCTAAGFLVLRHFPEIQKDQIIHSGLGLSIGVGLMGTIWSILAIIPNGLQALTVLIVLLTPFLMGGWRDIYNFFIQVDLKKIIPAQKTVRCIAVPSLVTLILCVPMTWHPLGTDALAFYFAQAKLVAFQNNFMPLAGYEVFSQIALPAEFSYAALMTIGPELAARMINVTEVWACALLFVSLAIATGAKEAGRWLSLLFMITSTSIVLLISDGKTDLYGCVMGLSALLLFIIPPLNTKKYFAIMGLAAGFAITAKLSYISILVPMLGFLFLWRMRQEKPLLKSIGPILIAGCIISSIVFLNILPMVAKNYLYFHEPLAPFLYFNDINNQNILSQTWFSPENTAWILKTYPLVWTLGQYPMQHGNISPLIFAAIPALLFISPRSILWMRDPAVALAISGLIGMLSWAIFFPSTVAPRYIFPALIAFMPLACRGLEFFFNKYSDDKIKQYCYVGLLTILGMSVFINNIPETKSGLKWVLYGPERSHINYVYEGLKKAEENLNEEDRLLLASWERSPLNARTLACLTSHNEKGIDIFSKDKKSKKSYWENIYLSGTKVVAVNIVGWKNFYEELNMASVPVWLTVKEEKVNDFYTIFILTPKKDAPPQEKKCGLDKSRNWGPKDILNHE